MITPPMAVNLFVASSLVKDYGVTIEQISRHILIFLVAEIIDILLVSNLSFLSMGILQLLR
jgi:TRAP-type C4-dicarboxylate transport system permease large subunit